MSFAAKRSAVEVIVSPPEGVGAVVPVTHVRSTLILTSLSALEKRGLTERYFTLLATEYREAIREVLAGTWVPLAMATAHYTACEGLGMTAQEQVDIGRAVGDRLGTTLASAIIGLAREAGATPWGFLSQLGRLHQRLNQGGGVTLLRTGPKDAIFEVHRAPLLAIPYARNGNRGMLQGACQHFCKRAYVSVTANSPAKVVFSVAWA